MEPGFNLPSLFGTWLQNVVCQAIIQEYVGELTDAEILEQMAIEFHIRSNLFLYTLYLNTLNGQHVAIICLPQRVLPSASRCIGWVDTNYIFIIVKTGAIDYGSDDVVFPASKPQTLLEKNPLGVPPAEPISGTFIFEDEVFSLKTWLMKDLSQRDKEIYSRFFHQKAG